MLLKIIYVKPVGVLIRKHPREDYGKVHLLWVIHIIETIALQHRIKTIARAEVRDPARNALKRERRVSQRLSRSSPMCAIATY